MAGPAPRAEHPPMDPLRTLLVDDSAAFRQAARRFLAGLDAIDVVVDVGSGEEALRLLVDVPFDLVLLDLRMPGMDGIEVLRRMAVLPEPRPAVVVLTLHDGPAYRAAAEAAGAFAFVPKAELAAALPVAVGRVRAALGVEP